MVITVASIMVGMANRSAAVGELHINDVAHVLLATTAEDALDAHALEARLVEVDSGAALAEVIALGVVVGHVGHVFSYIGILIGTKTEQLIVIKVDAVVKVVGVDEVTIGINRGYIKRAIVVTTQLTVVNKVDDLRISRRGSMVGVGC